MSKVDHINRMNTPPGGWWGCFTRRTKNAPAVVTFLMLIYKNLIESCVTSSWNGITFHRYKAFEMEGILEQIL